ncbi:putative inactive purple acid phosphatase 27 [Acorus calamus]|uniref:Purple acid phosphatase n=1 Tax=Acorus calamus TaxID=4465 RepID=A0AAV9D535_ACOCL|nr:putative inactive purple acid phosphatase 27 [Acorus calamus]
MIALHKSTVDIHCSAHVKASPELLGLKNQSVEWITVKFEHPNPSEDDWIAVFSPANFNATTYVPEMGNPKYLEPLLTSAPIKYQFAKYLSPNYPNTGKGSLKFRLINQRYDFAFALFSGGLSNPKLVSVSNVVAFSNPKAPLYPRLALGRTWDEMTVTWTSDYDIDEAIPFVEWGLKGEPQTRSPAGTHTYTRSSMCGPPAKTVGWRDPGFFHTSFLKDLWPNQEYTYKLGHRLMDGSYVWSEVFSFKAPPYPGQNSLQRVIVVGDIGKAERDGSNEYENYQPGSLNTTDTLIRDLDNYDIVFHIGDMPYSNGFLSQWDQFTEMVSPISSRVPYMVASGNHERDWPNSGSFYENEDSGGECGVPAETTYYVPAENRANFWYVADYGMFRFCVGDTEHDWREGTEQYAFIERCFATANRHKQPWLVFAAHRVLGYSSNSWYADQGSFQEPMGRSSLQGLWQKYRVDLAFFGHVHSYERTCQIYENICMSEEKSRYSGIVNGTIHVVVGGGGSHLSKFTDLKTEWSMVRDYDYGFVKLTAFNQSSLLFEYKKSRDGNVYDSFTITRDYMDVLACAKDSCWPTTLAT